MQRKRITKLDTTIPNVFTRSGMFSVRTFKRNIRPMVSIDVFTNDVGKYHIKYDGYELNMGDFQVFAAILRLHRMAGIAYGSPLQTSLLAIMRELGQVNSGSNYSTIQDCIYRLKRGNVSIFSGNARHDGSLIVLVDKDGRNHMTMTLSERISTIFDDDCTYVELSSIVKLRLSMSKWLYSFYRSQNTSVPMHINELRMMMRIGDNMMDNEFRRNLRLSLNEVAILRTGPFIGWEIKDSKVSVYRTPTKQESGESNE